MGVCPSSTGVLTVQLLLGQKHSMGFGPRGGPGERVWGHRVWAFGCSVRLAEALSGAALSSQNMKALQKPHPLKQTSYYHKAESKRRGSVKSEKTVRQLLGELYVDKEYLEKLLLDEGLGRFVCRRGRGRGGLEWMHNARGRGRLCHIGQLVPMGRLSSHLTDEKTEAQKG